MIHVQDNRLCKNLQKQQLFKRTRKFEKKLPIMQEYAKISRPKKWLDAQRTSVNCDPRELFHTAMVYYYSLSTMWTVSGNASHAR